MLCDLSTGQYLNLYNCGFVKLVPQKKTSAQENDPVSKEKANDLTTPDGTPDEGILLGTVDADGCPSGAEISAVTVRPSVHPLGVEPGVAPRIVVLTAS